jgi:hypothetical protein
VYNSTANFVKLAEYTNILQEWNILRDQKDNDQVSSSPHRFRYEVSRKVPVKSEPHSDSNADAFLKIVEKIMHEYR